MTNNEFELQIKGSDYGLEESKAQQIQEMFEPMLHKMVELEKEYNEVVQLEINTQTCKKAKELRLKYVKVRTGTADIHKKLKAFYLNGGRFVDGWKNTQKMASEGIESKLIEIEKHYENIEKERINKLQKEREEALTKFDLKSMPQHLGEMEEKVWRIFLTGIALQDTILKEAEKHSEMERIENQKKEKLFYDRKLEIAKYADFEPYEELTQDTTEEGYKQILVDLEDKKRNYQEIIKNLEVEKEKEIEKRKTIEEENKILKEHEKILANLSVEDIEKIPEVGAWTDPNSKLKVSDVEDLNFLITDLDILKTKYSFGKKQDTLYIYKMVHEKINEVIHIIEMTRNNFLNEEDND